MADLVRGGMRCFTILPVHSSLVAMAAGPPRPTMSERMSPIRVICWSVHPAKGRMPRSWYRWGMEPRRPRSVTGPR